MRRLLPRFEFWPTWAMYAPVILYCIYAILRVRRLVWITWVNPTEPFSGLLGQQKHVRLSEVPDSARLDMLLLSFPLSSPLASVLNQIESQFSWPVIIKADTGFRGTSPHNFPVTLVHTRDQAESLIASAQEPLIVQAYSPLPEEYGVFYVRLPGEKTGHITSLMGRQFLSVTGDGMSTVEDLLSLNPRSAQFLPHIRTAYPHQLLYVPESGENYLLEPIGNHCRGTIFQDARHLITPKLVAQFDALSHAMNDLYYARFDVKTESFTALERGQFSVIEVNGLNAEPAHIYTPGYSFWRGWLDLLHHWQWAARIARANVVRANPPAHSFGLLSGWNYVCRILKV